MEYGEVHGNVGCRMWISDVGFMQNVLSLQIEQLRYQIEICRYSEDT